MKESVARVAGPAFHHLFAPAAISAITIYANAYNSGRLDDKVDALSVKVDALSVKLREIRKDVATLVGRQDLAEHKIRTLFRDCLNKNSGVENGVEG